MIAAKQGKRRITISSAFFRWLLLIVAVAFLSSMAFTWIHQTNLSQTWADSLLHLNVEDVRQDVIDASDENLLKLTRRVAEDINSGAPTDLSGLESMLAAYDVAEINLIDAGGIIISSTLEEFMNYDMRNGAQSAEFLPLLEGTESEHVQTYQPTSRDPALFRKYAAVALKAGGFVQVGYDGERFQRDIDQYVINAARNRHVGSTGCVIIANEDWNIVSDRYGLAGKNLTETGVFIDRATMPENEVFHARVYGEACSCVYIFAEGYYIVSVLPENEIILERDSSLRVMGIMEILLFIVLFTVIFLLVKRLVLDNLGRVNSSLSRITAGDLDEVVNVRSNAEFSDLSDDINSTVDTLKHYIAAAAARIDEELAFAKSIQESALPSVFPPYPDRTDFSLFAAMHTAKEVGGDFYDFYLLDENRLAFLIADVSGKGIPAAMFMMTSKTVLRDYAERGDAPCDVFIHANAKLCEGNDAQMFLTAWMGFLDTDTGLVRFINAGHNAPVLIRNGKASFIQQKANLVMAMMEGVRYREQQLQLEPGDILYLYTDGVTEATASGGKMFGNDRLLALLSEDYGAGDAACQKICETVRRSIDGFAEGEPQFDDITQVCLYYAGKEHTAMACIKEKEFDAKTEQLYNALSFVEDQLDTAGCGKKEKKQVGMAVEEIFVNIASYAYPPEVRDGKIWVKTEIRQHSVTVTMIDAGVPYDPLQKPDPDLGMGVEDRQHGGFGIYMVKNAMDDVSYERVDGHNILTVKKQFI
ncbi:MAG: SpoIIE family protein phosphatase [Clostridia bacterium]|nr:SpoIIE family protein phosphatase [Clostridia bacterium]